VAAELAAALVDEGTLTGLEPLAREEIAVVVAGQEARLLALRVLGGGEPGGPRLCTRVGLSLPAEREPEPREEPRIEPGQHVRLVLRWVGATREEEAAAMLSQASVVAGGEPVRADAPGEGEEGGEAEAPVAADARVRGLSARVAGDEGRDDGSAELAAEVERDVRDVDPVARLARREDGLRRAARAVAVRARRIRPEPQRHAHGLAAGLARALERDRAVDASTHGDGDTIVCGWSGDAGAERLGKGVPGEAARPHGGGLERREAADLPAELPHAGAVAAGRDDAAARHGQMDPGEVAAGGGVPGELARVHEKREVPHPADEAPCVRNLDEPGGCPAGRGIGLARTRAPSQ
jgi:hypothetical protein